MFLISTISDVFVHSNKVEDFAKLLEKVPSVHIYLCGLNILCCSQQKKSRLAFPEDDFIVTCIIGQQIPSSLGRNFSFRFFIGQTAFACFVEYIHGQWNFVHEIHPLDCVQYFLAKYEPKMVSQLKFDIAISY